MSASPNNLYRLRKARTQPALRRALFLLRGGDRLHGCDDEAAARGFHLLLTGFLIWVGITEFVVVPLFVVRQAATAGLVLVMGGAALAALVLLRRGRSVRKSWPSKFGKCCWRR